MEAVLSEHGFPWSWRERPLRDFYKHVADTVQFELLMNPCPRLLFDDELELVIVSKSDQARQTSLPRDMDLTWEQCRHRFTAYKV